MLIEDSKGLHDEEVIIRYLSSIHTVSGTFSDEADQQVNSIIITCRTASAPSRQFIIALTFIIAVI